jgi:hypothetical protein
VEVAQGGVDTNGDRAQHEPVSIDDGSLVEVLRGNGPDGMTWRILAGGSPDDFATFAERGAGGATVTSGMRGPTLYPGQAVNTWIGQAEQSPPFVMVRTAVEVTRVVAVCASGHEYRLTFSDVIEPFQLRFGGTFLPETDPIAELRVDRQSTVEQ